MSKTPYFPQSRFSVSNTSEELGKSQHQARAASENPQLNIDAASQHGVFLI